MRIFRIIILIAGMAMLATGCASTQEKQALRAWQEEGSQWKGPEKGRANLPELGTGAALDDYLRYAQLNNPGLRAAFERWKVALEKVAPARSLADPRFTYGYFVREVETRVGPQQQRFGLAQTFPWAGALDLKGRMALQAAEVRHQQYEAAKNTLVYRLKKTYYELCYLNQAIEITRSNAQLLAYLEEVARAKYRGGTGAHGAVIKAQVELGKLEDRLGSLSDLQRPVKAKLNAVLNRPPGAPVFIPEDLPEIHLDWTGEDLVARLRERNPSLGALEAAAAREQLAIEQAGKDGFPSVTLGVDYIHTGDAVAANMGPPPDSGKDPIVAMVSLNVPLWRDKYRALQGQARSRYRAAEGEQQEKENQLVAELEMALYGLRDGERRITLYRDNLLPRAEQALGVIQQAFAAGQSDFLDLIDAQRVRLEFQLAHERARADQAQRLAEIEMLVGGPLVPAGTEAE